MMFTDELYRVQLQTSNLAESDYINASFINVSTKSTSELLGFVYHW